MVILLLGGLTFHILLKSHDLPSLRTVFHRHEIALVIDGDTYTQDSVVAELKHFIPSDVLDETPVNNRELVRLHLEDFIIIELIRRDFQAATRGVSPENLERHVIYEILPPEPELRQEALGVIAANYAFMQAIQKKIHIDETAVRAYYEAHLEAFRRGERIALAQIILENQAMAQQVYQQIQIEPEVFDYYAQLGQESPEGKSLLGLTHGQLGYLEIERMPDFLKSAVSNLAIGQVSKPVRVGDRFAIFKVLDRRPAGIAPLEEVENEIHVKLRDEAMHRAVPEWVRRVFRRHQVRVAWKRLGVKPDEIIWRWTPPEIVSMLAKEEP